MLPSVGGGYCGRLEFGTGPDKCRGFAFRWREHDCGALAQPLEVIVGAPPHAEARDACAAAIACAEVVAGAPGATTRSTSGWVASPSACGAAAVGAGNPAEGRGRARISVTSAIQTIVWSNAERRREPVRGRGNENRKFTTQFILPSVYIRAFKTSAPTRHVRGRPGPPAGRRDLVGSNAARTRLGRPVQVAVESGPLRRRKVVRLGRVEDGPVGPRMQGEQGHRIPERARRGWAERRPENASLGRPSTRATPRASNSASLAASWTRLAAFEPTWTHSTSSAGERPPSAGPWVSNAASKRGRPVFAERRRAVSCTRPTPSAGSAPTAAR